MEDNSLQGAASQALLNAVSRYFDLMYDCDISRFHDVFHTTAQLHGVIGGTLTVWPAQTYLDILSKRQSPKSLGAPREQSVLLIDCAAPDQAFTKVRVRINEKMFVDYLTWLRIDGDWRITAKAFHLESQSAQS